MRHAEISKHEQNDIFAARLDDEMVYRLCMIMLCQPKFYDSYHDLS